MSELQRVRSITLKFSEIKRSTAKRKRTCATFAQVQQFEKFRTVSLQEAGCSFLKITVLVGRSVSVCSFDFDNNNQMNIATLIDYFLGGDMLQALTKIYTL